MKIFKILVTFTLIAMLGTVASARQKQTPAQPSGGDASTGAAPALVIESFTHDFGEVKAGTPLRYAFKVKNLGKADLLINNVAPG
jgi:hypothetical protein